MRISLPNSPLKYLKLCSLLLRDVQNQELKMENTDIKSKKRKRKHHNAVAANEGGEVTAEVKPKEIPKKTKIQHGETDQRFEETADTLDHEEENTLAEDDHIDGHGNKGMENAGVEEDSDDDAQIRGGHITTPAATNTDLPSTSTLSLPSSLPEPQKFSDLTLSQKTLEALNEMALETMTEIQRRAIPVSMAGRDILGAAKTGSGKTLAFLIPAVEMLSSLRFKVR